MVYKFFDKKLTSLKKSASLNKFSGSDIVNEPDYQLLNERHELIITKF